MRIALVTDAWHPQINGVVTTLSTIAKQLEELGHQLEVITPNQYKTWPCPTYPEIRLALFGQKKTQKRLDEFKPDAIHIATEGPLGLAARRYCIRKALPFTTSFHTLFAEYVNVRTGIPLSLGYRFLAWFHNSATRTMVATPTLIQALSARGFNSPVLWSRGVDTDLFAPRERGALESEGPKLLYVGRVAIEKNIEAFLQLDHPGTKYVIGDGPQRPELEKKYPNVHFLGYKQGVDLARHMADADVFVFPSRTDTFGLVMLEALACGVPVAAYPVQGPNDVILDQAIGCLNENLEKAIEIALTKDRSACRSYALQYSWTKCAQLFESYLVPLDSDERRNPVKPVSKSNALRGAIQ